MATKTRSPNYPALNLADALASIKKVYEVEGRRKTGGDEIAQALGHKNLSGTSRVKVSALRKYGLLQADSDGLKVSDDALALLELPREHPEHMTALRNAALRPALFAELHETYGDDVPGDSILRHFLIKRNFNPKVADEIIQIYRDTMELVSRETDDYTAADEPDDEQQEAQMQATTDVSTVPRPADSRRVPPVTAPPHAIASVGVGGSFTESLEIRISADSKVRLLFDGTVTKEAIEKLRKYLELAEDDYPSKTQLEPPPSIEQSPSQSAIEMPPPEQKPDSSDDGPPF